jgi:heme exporter protein B
MIHRQTLMRDLRLSLLRGADGAAGLAFFILAVSIFAIAAGGDMARLGPFAPQLLSLSALFAALFGLENLYHRDHDDGTFDLLLLRGIKTGDIFTAKVAAHFLTGGLPLILAAIPAALMLGLPFFFCTIAFCALALQTLYTSLIGGLCAILTVGSRAPALLIFVLVMPLLLPAVILAAAAMEAGLAQAPVQPYLLLHLALVVAALPLALAGGAGLLRATQT